MSKSESVCHQRFSVDEIIENLKEPQIEPAVRYLSNETKLDNVMYDDVRRLSIWAVALATIAAFCGYFGSFNWFIWFVIIGFCAVIVYLVWPWAAEERYLAQCIRFNGNSTEKWRCDKSGPSWADSSLKTQFVIGIPKLLKLMIIVLIIFICLCIVVGPDDQNHKVSDGKTDI